MRHIHHIALHGLLLGSLAMAALPVCAAGAFMATVAQPAPRSVELLDGAVKAIQAGHADTAIKDFLDPLIADFNAQVKPDETRLYSAISPEESLLYLLSAGTEAAQGSDRRNAKVVDSSLATAYQLKGYALVELKRNDEARAVLQEGTRIAPMNPGIWNELGNLLKMDKNWPDSLAAYQKAEEGAKLVYGKQGDPGKSMLTRALRGEGFVLTETGELDKAQALYEQCLTINPNDAGAKQELAYIAKLRDKARQ